MDNKKDIEQQGNRTHNFPLRESKDVNPIDYFSKDEGFVFVYKKTEKLATALYMVTNFFGDSEPMKWTLRTKVSNLLSFIIGFKDIVTSREEEFGNEVKTRVLEIVSLLEISFRSGLVSPMNFSILKSEFTHMTRFLSDFRKEESHRMDLKESFFDLPGPVPKHSHDRVVSPIRHTIVSDSHKKTNRQNIIVNLLKKKKDVTINDIAETITDCSEKTIQRELISLISLGLVKKTGERRWSRYSLA